MVKKIIILALLFSSSSFFSSSNLFAQLEFEWARRDSGTKIETILQWPNIYYPVILNTGSALDSSGNLYVTAYTDSYSTGTYKNDFILIKYNNLGNILWKRVFNNQNTNEKAVKVIVDNSQNVYSIGTSAIQVTSILSDISIVKYDSAGNFLWSKIISDSSSYPYYDIVGIHNDINNNIYFCVNVYSYATDTKGYFFICKLTANGDLVWLKRIKGNPYPEFKAFDFKIDINGNLYFCGFEKTSIYPAFTCKISSTGDVLWHKNYYLPGGDLVGQSLVLGLNSVNVLVNGSAPGIFYSVFVLRYNQNDGAEILSKKIDSSGYGRMKKILFDNVNNFYVGGNFIDEKYSIFKLGTNFNTVWHSIIPISGTMRDFAVDKFNRFYFCGYTSYQTWITLSVNSHGNLINYITYTDPLNSYNFANSILVKDRNVFVTGYTTGRANHYDITTFKYSQLLNADINTEVLPVSDKLFQNFPNPFNPTTSIKFSINKKTLVNISIYDIRGVKISEVVNTDLKQGEYEYNWNASNFPSGIYFYSLTTENYKETKKMILLK